MISETKKLHCQKIFSQKRSHSHQFVSRSELVLDYSTSTTTTLINLPVLIKSRDRAQELSYHLRPPNVKSENNPRLQPGVHAHKGRRMPSLRLAVPEPSYQNVLKGKARWQAYFSCFFDSCNALITLIDLSHFVSVNYRNINLIIPAVVYASSIIFISVLNICAYMHQLLAS